MRKSDLAKGLSRVYILAMSAVRHPVRGPYHGFPEERHWRSLL
ncbi:hypothetical protein [Desulfovibrio sp. SGI.169]